MTQIWGHLTLIGDDFDLDYVTRELGTVPMTQRKPDEILGNGKAFGQHLSKLTLTHICLGNDIDSLITLAIVHT